VPHIHTVSQAENVIDMHICGHHIRRMRNRMTLEEWKRARGLTDEALADLLGIERSSVTKIRRGKASPSLAVIKRIRDLTGGAVTGDEWINAA
jgi:transcriptional regulator with XRE-family HTH domain